MTQNDPVVSIEDQIACVHREVAMREKLYARWIQDHKITQKTADIELARMRAVLQTLLGLKREAA